MMINKQNSSFWLLGIGVISMVLFPILPSLLKPLCVISFAPFFFFYFKNGFDVKSFLPLSCIFCVAALSLIYSTNIELGLKRLETFLPLLAFPLVFSVLKKTLISKVVIVFWRKFFLLGFLFSSALLVVLMFFYVGSLGFYSELVTYDYSMSYIEAYMWVSNDHPIYLALIFGVSVILGLEYLFQYTFNKVKLGVILIGIIINLSGVIFLQRKGVILALSLALMYYLWVKTKVSKRIKLVGGFILIFGISLVAVKYSPRILEFLDINTYSSELNEKNSTSIRLGIYACVFEVVDDVDLWGYGIGDQQQVLNDCYESTSIFLLKGNYNTHNQFLSFLLGTGWIGLVCFLIAMGVILYNGIRFRSDLLVAFWILFCVEMMTENILERQTGVILFSFIMVFFTFTDITRVNKKLMKRVLIIGPFPEPTTGVSLANKVVSEILEEDDEFSVSVLNTSFNKFDEKIGDFSWGKLFFNLKFNLSIFKVVFNDIVYLTPGQTFFGIAKYLLFFLTAWVFGKEIIFHVHGNHLQTEYESLEGVKKRLFHFILSRAKKGIALSESLTGNVIPFVPTKGVFHLYNFAQDHDVFELKRVQFQQDGLKIVFLSNLMKEKGINDLLDALSILEERGIAYEARIAGNIDVDNEALLMSKLHGLTKTKFVGVVHGDKKVALLNWANSFVLPTYYQMEGQPISILESMAAKCVIVTTRHAGIPDVIKENINGVYVDIHSPKSIVSGLLKLTEQSELFDHVAENNRSEYKEKYTIQVFGNNLKMILIAE